MTTWRSSKSSVVEVETCEPVDPANIHGHVSFYSKGFLRFEILDGDIHTSGIRKPIFSSDVQHPFGKNLAFFRQVVSFLTTTEFVRDFLAPASLSFGGVETDLCFRVAKTHT